jgi:GNAT superfamily N-acetyltransferase
MTAIETVQIDHEIFRFENEVQMDKKTEEDVRIIYEAEFLAEERKPFSNILEDISRGREAIYIYMNKYDGTVVGFAMVIYLPVNRVLVLEYLAVKRDLQSKGLGSKLFRRILKDLEDEGETIGLIFEVDPLETATDFDGRVNRVRRINFYHKNNSTILENARGYMMPNQTGEGGIPMLLMWNPNCKSNPNLPRIDIENIIIEMYEKLYGRQEKDPLVVEILRRIRLNYCS